MEPEKLESVAHRHGEQIEDCEHGEHHEEFVDELRAIFEWIVQDSKSISAAGIAARALTVARALNIAEGREQSMRAQAARLELSREWLSNLLDEFSSQWNIRVDSGKSPAAREIYRRSRLARVRMSQEPVQNELF